MLACPSGSDLSGPNGSIPSRINSMHGYVHDSRVRFEETVNQVVQNARDRGESETGY
ncbi:MAG TPA: hypothetical protein VFG14_05335 [Chthoniobacteraceae bacterium]|nr:hypothetical protein [Chthoniobacteraceae bacterium]